MADSTSLLTNEYALISDIFLNEPVHAVKTQLVITDVVYVFDEKHVIDRNGEERMISSCAFRYSFRGNNFCEATIDWIGKS